MVMVINMKKILFVIGSLQIGGAETVLVDVLNNIYKEFEITLLLIEKRGELIKELNSNIKLNWLTKGDEYCKNLLEKKYNQIKRSFIYRFLGKNKWYIKRIYKKILNDKFDKEIAFLVGLPSEIVKNSPNRDSKKIAWVHAEVTKEDRITYLKYKNIIGFFDEIVGVSDKSIKVFEKTFPESKGKVKLIYNYIDDKKIKRKAELEKANFNDKKINFLSVGRLVNEKGFDRILHIAKKFEKKVDFYIIGDGILKTEFKTFIRNNNIKNVFFLGLKRNPYPFIKSADVFLLSSRSEAYPTVLLEALILNKKILATDVPGVKEILHNYDNKIIVSNNDDSIENGINLLLTEIGKKNSNYKLNSNCSFYSENEKNLRNLKRLLNE